MPELPEVQTITSQLQKEIPNLTIRDVWSDWIKMLQVLNHNDHIKIKKSQKFTKKSNQSKKASILFERFKNDIVGKKIKKVSRIGKNILIYLSSGHLLLVHQKMSGHLLLGKWKIKNGVAVPEEDGIMKDKMNGYIHLIFYLSDGRMLALSDLRKFAKVVLGPEDKVLSLSEIKKLGPDVLDKNFSFESFRKIIKSKKGKIKQVLLDQSVVSGVGNIYADESLWKAKIHPETQANKIDDARLKRLYNAIRDIMKFSIKVGGDSMSDFRNIYGKKGGYQKYHKVYQREKEACFLCKAQIKRIKISGRSAHFCPSCQKKA